MAMILNPYLTFGGNAEEAMSFYSAALGGDLSVSRFREFGMDADGVMHASLTTPAGFVIFASDTMDGMVPLVVGTSMQMSLSGDDDDALRGYWDRLSEGGQVLMPLEKQMWGDVYGMLVDKFGIQWHVNISGDS